MASFPRVRVFGLWTALSPLLHTEMEQFDAQLSKALNADEGGTWAPSAKIEIGGEGIKITGLAEFTGEFKVTTEAKLQGGATVSGGNLAVSQDIAVQGALDVDGNCAFGGTLIVTGGASIGGTCAITGNVTLSGTCAVTDDLSTASDLSVQGNAAIQGNADVTGDLTADGATVETLAIHGTVVFGEVFTATGKGSVTSDFAVGGALTVTGNATLNGTTKAKGRFKRRVLTMTDAGTTVSVSNYDMVFMPNGVMSWDRTLNISTIGAEEGDVLCVITRNPTFFVYVDWGEGAYGLKVASDKRDWLEVTFIGGAWVRTAWGDRSALPSRSKAHVLHLRARKPFAARLVVGANVAVLPARWCPGLAAPTPTPSCVHVAGGTGPVGAPLRLADLCPFGGATRTGAGDLLAGGAHFGGLGVVGAGEEQ